MKQSLSLSALCVLCTSYLAAGLAFAEGSASSTLNLYGETGLIDMPTADSAPDAQFSQSIGTFRGEARTTLTFQISPRLSGSFRYATIDEYTGIGTGRTWDRSFDLRYRFLDEGKIRPAVSIGLRDFLGTGLYTGEYLVATKGIGEKVRATAGLGWGRLGSNNGFTNPLGVFSDSFKTRRPRDVGRGGTFDPKQWFTGDAALFGGLEYAYSPDLSFKAEYSSDGYTKRSLLGTIDRNSSLNFGVTYKGRKGVELSGYYVYGSEVGVSLSFIQNPKERSSNGGTDRAPMPVKVREQGASAAQSWALERDTFAAGQLAIKKTMETDGFLLEAMDLSATQVRVRVRNSRYSAEPQMIGRVARILTRVMPASVETFVIEPVQSGIPTSAVTLQRSDIENYEFAPDGAWEIYSRTRIGEAGPSDGYAITDEIYPRFSWGLAPYVETGLFDPDAPLRVDMGAEVHASYEFVPGLILSGTVQQKIVGNLDESRRGPNSVLPHVRTESIYYQKNTGPVLRTLTLSNYFRPAENLYGRLTAGYLEKMYGGVSAEVLWKPVKSRLALGAEINYVKQRDFDLGFGFRDYEVLTGHASAYYDFGNGYHGQLDAGKYLAGDYGGTLTLSREFSNGWKIGAFATLTDVPFEDFGEGSFDKGIFVTVPLDWVLGKPTPKSFTTLIRPIQRDGGARLMVDDRLYGVVRDSHRPELEKRWGRFWR